MSQDPGFADPGSDVVARVGDTVSSGVDGLRRSVADVPVFAVHEVEGRKVITAASISYSGGFGFGGGSGPGDEVHTVGALSREGGVEGDARAGGGGGGGGGTGEGRPVAVIDVSGGKVHIHPVVDWTKVAAALVAAFVTMWIAARRGR